LRQRCVTLTINVGYILDVNISPRDPRWIGAWWVGFLMFGIGSVVSALPVMCFPRKFREKPKLQSSSLKNERPVKVMGGNRIVDYNLLDNHMFIYKSTPTTKRSE
jgi:dipeptide/tripeptide permease